MELVLITALGVGMATVIGAIIGFAFKKVSHKFSDIVMSFAAGIMLAAAVIGLILPAIEYGGGGIGGLIICIVGIFTGAICLNLMDKLIPHLHKLAGPDIEEHKKTKLNKTLLFVLAIAIVFRGIPYWIGLIIIPIALLFLDRKALLMVDYPLLLTFVFFFIFSGNMARIDVVREFFSMLLDKSTLLFSVTSCQVISNVPSAILLSQFTDNYQDLLVGVNIGGCGTLISSLASLITFREYTKHNPGKAGKYIGEFSLFNFGFLILLVGFMMLLKLI